VAALAAFSSVVGVQQAEIRELRREAEALRTRSAAIATETADAAQPGAETALASARFVALPDEREEIARLRTLADELAAQAAGLESREAENQELRAVIARKKAALTEGDRQALELHEKAARIRCVNNMKMLGIAARVWATDYGPGYPPDIMSMRAEMVSPAILICPSDDFRTPAPDWESFTAVNCSYEYLGAGANETQVDRVMWRCPFHGHIGLCDGSVQQSLAKTAHERFEWRDGGIYYNAPKPEAPPGGPISGAAGAGGASPAMSPELMRRYGLLPPEGQADNPPAEEKGPQP
jgi:hypothetical protein